MKTFITSIEKPRLIISYDEYSESPRTLCDNIGYFFTNQRNYKSPDGNIHALYNVMIKTADEAENTADHIKFMKQEAQKLFKESAPKNGNSHDESLHVIDIYPIYCYDHNGRVYRRGTASGFDYSNCGFYFVTAEGLAGGIYDTEKIEKIIDQELLTYSQWVNGEVYQFTLYNNQGEQIEAIGGFYSIDDIREYLPIEFDNEYLRDYFIN